MVDEGGATEGVRVIAPLDVDDVLLVAEWLDPKLAENDLQSGSVQLALSKIPPEEQALPVERAAHLVYWLWIEPPIRPAVESAAQARRTNTETADQRPEWIGNLRLEIALYSALHFLTKIGYECDIREASPADVNDLLKILRKAEARLSTLQEPPGVSRDVRGNLHMPRLRTINELTKKLEEFFPTTPTGIQTDWDFSDPKQFVGIDPSEYGKSALRKSKLRHQALVASACIVAVVVGILAGKFIGQTLPGSDTEGISIPVAAFTKSLTSQGSPDMAFAPFFSPAERNTRSTKDGLSGPPELNVIGDRDAWPDERRFTEVANLFKDPTRFTRGEISVDPTSTYAHSLQMRFLVDNAGAAPAENVLAKLLWTSSESNRTIELTIKLSGANTLTTDIYAGIIVRCTSVCSQIAEYNATVTDPSGHSYTIDASAVAAGAFKVGSTSADGVIQPGSAGSVTVTFDVDIAGDAR